MCQTHKALATAFVESGQAVDNRPQEVEMFFGEEFNATGVVELHGSSKAEIKKVLIRQS